MSNETPDTGSNEGKESRESEEELTFEEYVYTAEKLVGLSESIPFTGLKPEAYKELKMNSEEFPGFATDIDVLIERMKVEGIKVVVEKNGQVFVLPFESNDIENDSIFPRHLGVTAETMPELAKLIQLGKQPSKK